ncbi:MAG: ABC transporter ATP-binding protein [Treponema sp.]|nr:ABC transporter ATP-binding protein [Treponema sp.]
MSVTIKIRNAVKAYGDTTIIENLSLDINEGEFFTLLGPSGCGKTTLLRMIAGFNSIEGGDFYFNDKRINDMNPVNRNIGMVFQNYAIFPNMNVEKNVAFGLKTRKLPKEEIEKKTNQFLQLMKIEEYRNRMPERLSGGQQQRVALARALAITPDVLLMDEPLSNLDAKLRVEMRTVIKEIQNSIGITTVYVTHDQEEAMAVSDRIAVMNQGVIQQIGSPKILYQRPANLFVATFIGHTNVIKSEIKVENGKAYLVLPGEYKVELTNLIPEEIKDRKVIASIRPEELKVEEAGSIGGLKATVDDAVFLGLNTHYFVHFENGEKAEIIQESQIDSIIAKGTKISLSIKTEKINVFDESGNKNLVKGVINDLDAYKTDKE